VIFATIVHGLKIRGASVVSILLSSCYSLILVTCFHYVHLKDLCSQIYVLTIFFSFHVGPRYILLYTCPCEPVDAIDLVKIFTHFVPILWSVVSLYSIFLQIVFTSPNESLRYVLFVAIVHLGIF